MEQKAFTLKGKLLLVMSLIKNTEKIYFRGI